MMKEHNIAPRLFTHNIFVCMFGTVTNCFLRRRRSLCLLEFYRDKIHRLCRGVSSSQKISGTTLIFREPCGLSLIKIKIIFSLRLGLATVWATGNKFIKIILICRCGVRVFGRSGRPPLQNYIHIIGKAATGRQRYTYYIIFIFSAAVFASLRRFTPSFCNIWLTWLFTVASLISNISPISALLLSAHTSLKT